MLFRILSQFSILFEAAPNDNIQQRIDIPRITGKSLSETLIFASTNPQYDDRLFIKLQVQYMKIPSSKLGSTVHINCF